MFNMYTNRVARGGGSIFSRGKGRESAMTVLSGFKRGYDHCNKPGYKNT